jgi:hypothetical protein
MDIARGIQRERLFYLEFLAIFTGQVSRKDLVSRFGISDPAATKDLSFYAELAPGMLAYDLRRRCYVLNRAEPHFNHDVEQALYSLAGDRAIAIDTEHGKRLPSWVNASIKRKVPVAIASAITRCMYQGRAMSAEYTSLSSGITKRTITPLALVNDGLRWHVRSFDHTRQEYRDFNLTRFHSVTEEVSSEATLADDKEWNTMVTLSLIPHPRAEHPEAIRTDYDITSDAKSVAIRACLVGYFLRHWHIDYSDSASGNPRAQQLFLANKNELIEAGVSNWAFEP